MKDQNSSGRKKDHIDLAFKSRVSSLEIDDRFYYEPVISGHPDDSTDISTRFLDIEFGAPLWVSSMTGGTVQAKEINKNLAKACAEFRLGMGLGSCRSLLYNNEHLQDFQVRKYIGDQPLYANLGIAQVEQLLENGKLSLIRDLIYKTETDGLIVHVNPLQEWLQPEGDRIKISPGQIISEIIEKLDIRIIVKEVGQGFGPESLKILMQMPLEAIEFAAHGGTNFTMLELMRNNPVKKNQYLELARIGHSAEEMVEMVNVLVEELKEKCRCNHFIISGGVKGFLDGYYLMSKLQSLSIYGQASNFLKYAKENYDELHSFIESQIQGLKLAKSFLRVKIR